MKADAIVNIIDQNKFSDTLYSVKAARNRLDDIVSPAIRNVITSQKKNELFIQKKEGNDWGEIKPEFKEDIISLLSPYPKIFGIEMTNLRIEIK